MRNVLGTLLISAGVPMLTMGDEFGRTQRGNNNAYCQDSALTWMRWERKDWQDAFLAQTRRLLQLRREHPALRPSEYGESGQRMAGSTRLDWWNAAGLRMTIDDWDRSHDRTMQMLAESTPMEERYSRVLVVFHGSPHDAPVTTPRPDGATALELLWDSAADVPGDERALPGDVIVMTAMSMRVYAVHGVPAAGVPAATVMRVRTPPSPPAPGGPA
jgi:glycogen operon protein